MTTLTEDRFRKLAEAYGSELERWPSAERTAARELILKRPELRSVLKAEAELDAWLDSARVDTLPAALLKRLEAVPENAPQPFPWRARSLLTPAVGWAFAAAFGLWLGARADALDVDLGSEDTIEASADADAAEAELIELASGDLAAFEELP
jgi:hypothetical protein